MRSDNVNKGQAGVALLEVLIAILILSFGILGIIGLQANSITMTTDARYRVEASAFAERLIAQMWLDPLNLASYAYGGSGSVPGVLAAWYNDVTAGSRALPGAADFKPTITIDANNLVTLYICWSPPGSSSPPSAQACATVPSDKAVHRHVVVANITQDPEQ